MQPRVAVRLFVLALALASLSTVHGQTCGTYTVEGDCYNARATCRWFAATSTCISGAPSTCEQMYRDPVGCSGTCARNIFSGGCYTLPTAAPVSSTCNSQTTVSGCTSNGCYYDAYWPSTTSTAGKCVASISEIKSNFPTCFIYTNYPSNAFSDACSDYRACSPLSGTTVCQNPIGSGTTSVLTANRVFTSYVYQLLNPSLNVDTLQFGIVNSIPTGQFLNTTMPLHHTITFGSTNLLPRPLQPSKCNDLLQAQPALNAGLPTINPAYTDTSGLLAGLVSSTNLVFSQNNSLSTALYQAVGYANVGGTSITASVSITNQTVSKQLSANANWLVANCGATRTTISTDQTLYIIPITLDVRSAYYQSSAPITIYSLLSTFGTVSFGATQRAALTIFADAPVDTSVNATVPGTVKRRFTTYFTFRTTNPNVVVGLRGLQDVSMISTGGTVQTTPPTNCFGTRPISVTAPTGLPTACTDIAATTPPTYCWVSAVTLETRYNVPTLDGKGLTLCSNQLPSVRIAEMGSDIPYPSGLDTVHSFYQFAKQWPIGNLTTGPFSSIGTDYTGAMGDYVDVKLTQLTPVDINYFAGVVSAPTCGILPSVTSTCADLIVPTYMNKNNVSFAVDLRNVALDTNSLLIFACCNKNTTINTYRLNFKTSLYFLPLDATGEVILNAAGGPLATLPFSSVALTAPYTIRSQPGAHTAAVNAQIGCDSIGVSVRDLQSRMTGNGYAMVAPYYDTLPVIPAASSGTRRRMLSTQDSTDDMTGTVIRDDAAYFGILLSANLTSNLYIPDPKSAAAGQGLAVIGVVAGTVVGVLAVAAAAAAVSTAAVATTGATAVTASVFSSSSYATAALGTSGRHGKSSNRRLSDHIPSPRSRSEKKKRMFSMKASSRSASATRKGDSGARYVDVSLSDDDSGPSR
jgi:hypothetical protein